MGILGGHKLTGLAVAGLLAAGLVGCGGAASTVTKPTESTTPSGSPAATKSAPASPARTNAPSTPPDGQTMSQTQIHAAIVAGAPPKDLAWMVPPVPANWKKLRAETGTMQWQTRDGCGLMLDQPAGIGTEPTPTSEEVLEHTAERNSVAFAGKPKPVYSGRTTRKLPNIVQGLDGTSLVTFREATVDYGKIRSQQLAFRNGDFALSFVGFCRDAKTFAVAKKADFEPLLAKLQVHTRY